MQKVWKLVPVWFNYLWANTHAFFIEVPVPSQESDWSCICVFGLSIFTPTIL
jgi:hypothetical protein